MFSVTCITSPSSVCLVCLSHQSACLSVSLYRAGQRNSLFIYYPFLSRRQHQISLVARFHWIDPILLCGINCSMSIRLKTRIPYRSCTAFPKSQSLRSKIGDSLIHMTCTHNTSCYSRHTLPCTRHSCGYTSPNTHSPCRCLYKPRQDCRSLLH